MRSFVPHRIQPMLGITAMAALLALACAAPRAVSAPPPAGVHAGVDAEVRRALEQFNATAAAGDVKACLALFEDRADILMVGSDKGEVFKGPAAMEGWLAALMRNNRFGWEMDRVDISHHGDTAWAFVEGRMVVKDPAGKLRFKAPYRFSAVLVRRGQGWVWRLFHGSAPGKE